MGTTWSWITFAAIIGVFWFLLSRIDKHVETRQASPEQIRQTGEKYFTGKAKVTVDLLKTKLNREQLARLALERGYEYKSAENRGKQGIFFNFLHKGAQSAPAPFLPESPQYAEQMELEARGKRRLRWYTLAICVGLYGLAFLISR